MSIITIRPNNGLLPYGVIVAATLGDPMAVQTVLRHYRGYISKLAACAVYDDYGNAHIAVDTDVRDYMEDALITGILNFDLAA